MSKKNVDDDDSKSKSKLTKRDERLLNKKRKWAAFIDVCKANDIDRRAGMSGTSKREVNEKEEGEISSDQSLTKKHKVDEGQPTNGMNGVHDHKQVLANIQAELKTMRAKISNMKRNQNPPFLRIKEVGYQAQFQIDETHDVVPLFVSDIKHLLLVAVFGQLSPRKPRWCTISHCADISHVVMVIVDGLSAKDFRKHASTMNFTSATFESMFEILPSQQFNTKAIDEILSIVDVMRTTLQILDSEFLGSNEDVVSENATVNTDELASVKKFEGYFNINFQKNIPPKLRVTSVPDKFPRTRLLLTPEQMLTENYPLNIAGLKVEEGFIYTKDEYTQVTSMSPLFGVDCEMCMTNSSENELARVSIVDEELNVIYDTLVKPRNKITNYLTKYSGITAKMLKDVNVRIEDVQKEVRRILPSDAILCGQSLNMDLRAMKMMHPYVIDTSIIFNLSGVRRVKASLKNLTKFFLKEDIQNKRGHDSIEDSRSALRLVQLKLANSINFGDVILSPERRGTITTTQTNGHNKVDSRRRKKKVAILSSVALSMTDTNNAASIDPAGCTVTTLLCVSNKHVSRRTRQAAIENDLTIAHMQMSLDESLSLEDEKSKFSKLDKRFKRIYESCSVNSLVVLMFADSNWKSDTGYYENGICMIKIKPQST